MKRFKQTGFTLVEMLVVVVIVGIVASIAIPSFSATIKNRAISATTNEIISTLQTARSEAIKRSQSVRVCFVSTLTNPSKCLDIVASPDNTNFIVAYLDANNDENFDTGEDFLYVSNELDENVIFKKTSSSGKIYDKSVAFGLRGEAVIDRKRNKNEAAFGLCDDRGEIIHGRVIKIGKTGRAQASDIKSSDNISCS